MARKPVKAKKPAVDKETLAKLRQVSSPTLTTVMMRDHGLHNTCLRDVLPVDPELEPFAGPAFTVRYMPIREDLRPEQYLDHANNQMTPAVEKIRRGSVMVMDANGRNDVGILGGNILMRLKQRGIAAAVTDGGMRDIPEIVELGMSVACSAVAAPPSFTYLMIADTQRPISCGGVPVFPGDIIVGDCEGVICVPAAIAAEVADAGLAMDHIEGYINRRLEAGEPMPGLYPPSPKVKKQYDRWVAKGEPDKLK